MKAIRNFVTLFAVAALAAAMGPSRASAQDFQGKFTLPFPAQWGSVTLAPGSYSIDISHNLAGQSEVLVRGESKGTSQGAVFASKKLPIPQAGKNTLVCIHQGSSRIVRSLELGTLGQVMYFQLPNGAVVYAQKEAGKNRTLLAQGPELIQRVPLAVSGK